MAQRDIKKVGLKNCGTLPDFGNFVLDRTTGEEYDATKASRKMMPFARGVSAKSNDFDDQGTNHTDYRRMMKIVLAANYHGYLGVEYSGNILDEYAGIAPPRGSSKPFGPSSAVRVSF